MAVYRKFYRAGSSVVVAIPYYLLEEMNVEQGDYAELKRIGVTSLELIVRKESQVLSDRYRNKGRWRASMPPHLKKLAGSEKDLSD